MKQEEIRLAKLAGLIPLGDDETGEPDFMGTEAQFEKFEHMKSIYYETNCY